MLLDASYRSEVALGKRATTPAYRGIPRWQHHGLQPVKTEAATAVLVSTVQQAQDTQQCSAVTCTLGSSSVAVHNSSQSMDMDPAANHAGLRTRGHTPCTWLGARNLRHGQVSSSMCLPYLCPLPHDLSKNLFTSLTAPVYPGEQFPSF